MHYIVPGDYVRLITTLVISILSSGNILQSQNIKIFQIYQQNVITCLKDRKVLLDSGVFLVKKILKYTTQMVFLMQHGALETNLNRVLLI